MRYAIALVAASTLIVAGVLFVRHTEESVEVLFRQGLRDAKAAGQLPPGIDPEQSDPRDFGIDLPAPVARRVMISHILVTKRFVFIPAVIVVSLGIARSLKRRNR